MITSKNVTFVSVASALSISAEEFRMLEEGHEPMRRGDWGVWVVDDTTIELFRDNEVGFRIRCVRAGDRVLLSQIELNPEMLELTDEAAKERALRLGEDLIRQLSQRIQSLNAAASARVLGETLPTETPEKKDAPRSA
jgi:hypothetical protein